MVGGASLANRAAAAAAALWALLLLQATPAGARGLAAAATAHPDAAVLMKFKATFTNGASVLPTWTSEWDNPCGTGACVPGDLREGWENITCACIGGERRVVAM